MRLNLFNVDIRIEYSLFLVLGFSIVVSNYSFLYVILFSALHELGHVAALYLMGGKADTITVAYYGIGLKYSTPLGTFKTVFILLCGPLVNLLLLLFGIGYDINIALLVINLLPIYPLDGGRILKLLLNQVFSLSVSDKLFIAVTLVFILLLLGLCFYLKSTSLLLIVIYVLVYSVNNSFD